MMGSTTTPLLLPRLSLGNDLRVQEIEMQINGCGAEYGIWLWPVGARTQ